MPASLIAAFDRLQHQRRANAWLDPRVGAGKHQRQAPVGDVFVLGGLQLLGGDPQLAAGKIAGAPPAAGVDQLAARDRQQPRLGILGTALGRPVGKRCREGFRQRVLGRRDIAGARGEVGDKLAVAAPRDAFGLGARRHRPFAGGHES